jgi:hypothetical protein
MEPGLPSPQPSIASMIGSLPRPPPSLARIRSRNPPSVAGKPKSPPAGGSSPPPFEPLFSGSWWDLIDPGELDEAEQEPPMRWAV